MNNIQRRLLAIRVIEQTEKVKETNPDFVKELNKGLEVKMVKKDKEH